MSADTGELGRRIRRNRTTLGHLHSRGQNTSELLYPSQLDLINPHQKVNRQERIEQEKNVLNGKTAKSAVKRCVIQESNASNSLTPLSSEIYTESSSTGNGDLIRSAVTPESFPDKVSIKDSLICMSDTDSDKVTDNSAEVELPTAETLDHRSTTPVLIPTSTTFTSTTITNTTTTTSQKTSITKAIRLTPAITTTISSSQGSSPMVVLGSSSASKSRMGHPSLGVNGHARSLEAGENRDAPRNPSTLPAAPSASTIHQRERLIGTLRLNRPPPSLNIADSLRERQRLSALRQRFMSKSVKRKLWEVDHETMGPEIEREYQNMLEEDEKRFKERWEELGPVVIPGAPRCYVSEVISSSSSSSIPSQTSQNEASTSKSNFESDEVSSNSKSSQPNTKLSNDADSTSKSSDQSIPQGKDSANSSAQSKGESNNLVVKDQKKPSNEGEIEVKGVSLEDTQAKTTEDQKKTPVLPQSNGKLNVQGTPIQVDTQAQGRSALLSEQQNLPLHKHQRDSINTTASSSRTSEAPETPSTNSTSMASFNLSTSSAVSSAVSITTSRDSSIASQTSSPSSFNSSGSLVLSPASFYSPLNLSSSSTSSLLTSSSSGVSSMESTPIRTTPIPQDGTPILGRNTPTQELITPRQRPVTRSTRRGRSPIQNAKNNIGPTLRKHMRM